MLAATITVTVGEHIWCAYTALAEHKRDVRPSNAIQWRMLSWRQAATRDVQLLVVEAYRSPALQQQLWSAARAEIAGTHPLATPPEIDRLTRLVVARPGAAGGGHQTGAAVDITLADAAGTELWMGTGVGEFSMGDRLWAAYGRRPEAHFGPLPAGEPPQT